MGCSSEDSATGFSCLQTQRTEAADMILLALGCSSHLIHMSAMHKTAADKLWLTFSPQWCWVTKPSLLRQYSPPGTTSIFIKLQTIGVRLRTKRARRRLVGFCEILAFCRERRRPHPPASTPPVWVAAAPRHLSPLPTPRTRAPPSPWSPGSPLAAGTSPAPGPQSAAPCGRAPWGPGGRRRGRWRSARLCGPCGCWGGGARRAESGFGGETTGRVSRQNPSGWRFPSPPPVSYSPFLFCTSWWKQSKSSQKRYRCFSETFSLWQQHFGIKSAGPHGLSRWWQGQHRTETKPFQAFIAIWYRCHSNTWSVGLYFRFAFHFSSNSPLSYFTTVLVCDKLKIYETWPSTTNNWRNADLFLGT